EIQCVDREAIEDFCVIAMGFLLNNEPYKNKEYKNYAEDRDQLASFDIFSGVKDFINAALKADKEDLMHVLWNNEIRLNATGSSRTLMDIISHTLTDFSSNCKQPLQDTN
ncbi:hypothetical protein K501DRAFT_163838, partial [Backusella circina FSU 941]